MSMTGMRRNVQRQRWKERKKETGELPEFCLLPELNTGWWMLPLLTILPFISFYSLLFRRFIIFHWRYILKIFIFVVSIFRIYFYFYSPLLSSLTFFSHFLLPFALQPDCPPLPLLDFCRRPSIFIPTHFHFRCVGSSKWPLPNTILLLNIITARPIAIRYGFTVILF